MHRRPQVGAVSIFLYALVTGRAYQINTYGEIPGFEQAWDPSLAEIDWWLHLTHQPALQWFGC